MGIRPHVLQVLLLCQCLALTTGCTSSGGEATLPGEVSGGRAYAGWGSRARPDKRPPELSETSQLSDYLAYAALNNPGLEAAFNRWKAELERIPQLTALPDPRFTYRYYIENVETRVGPQRHSFGIAQTFPWFGKLKLRGDVAMEAANAAQARYEAKKLKLFQQVKDAYYEYYYLGRAVEVVGNTRELMKYFESIARAKYKVAAVEYADVIRAQVELGKLDDRLTSLKKLRSPIMADLNASLNRPLSTELPWPTSIPLESVAVTDDELLGLLSRHNPELVALGHDVERHRKGVALARKDYYPDVTLSLGYIETGPASMAGVSDSGKAPIIAGVTVNLPIWAQKYRAKEREARRRQWAALHAKADRTNQLGFRVKRVIYEFLDAERKMGLYRDTLVPMAKQSLKVVETSYRAGKGSFLDLIDAQRVMLEFELLYERALTNHAQSLAKLEMLVGVKLPRTETDTGPAESEAKETVPKTEPEKEKGGKGATDKSNAEGEPAKE